MISLEEIKKLYDFEPIPVEGGFFVSTYRSNNSSAILFLETKDDFSRIHKLKGDEVYHFYLGDPVEILLLNEDGRGEIKILGQDLLNNEQVQLVVKANTWQGSRLKDGGKYGFALMGTTMAPSFKYEDFEGGNKEELLKKYPEFQELIKSLS